MIRDMNEALPARTPCVLAFLETDGRAVDDSDRSELRSLAETAGLEPVAEFSQARPKPDPKTYLGSGKVLEIRDAMEKAGVDLLIVDGELSPSQEGRLEDLVGRRVLDRTELILDIFAQRARTAEGRLQVEVAQLAWRLPRLRGLGKHLSRLGGGIGTRGPGETKLETDRQSIFRRMKELDSKIQAVKRQRETARLGRPPYPVVALLGYTNAGKTTLLSRLATDVPVGENMLFATLDPLTRSVSMPSGGNMLLTDTVGFIRRLPHSLVAAFRATLEEVLVADLWLFVFDLETGDVDRQEAAIRDVLGEIGAEERPVVRAFNKSDRFPLPDLWTGVPISALTGQGIGDLLEALEESVAETRVLGQWRLPFNRGDLLDRVHRFGQVLEETYDSEGTFVSARVHPALAKMLDRMSERA